MAKKPSRKRYTEWRIRFDKDQEWYEIVFRTKRQATEMVQHQLWRYGEYDSEWQTARVVRVRLVEEKR